MGRELSAAVAAPAALKRAKNILMAVRMDAEEAVEYLAGKVVVGALTAEMNCLPEKLLGYVWE